ncbi:MAG: GTPase HflX [Deltaproteobacteria bacterium]|nr:GTPase HflX [Deltaproteobacteria bacterium]
MEKIYGKTTGLKASQIRQLQNLYRRKISGKEVITRELTRRLAFLSYEIKRQIALLITRKGEIAFVVVGDHRQIFIPDLGRYRLGKGRLKGLRCVHTHVGGEPLSREDISDLVLLGLDFMVCVEVREGGVPGALSFAHILPKNVEEEGWRISRVPDIGHLDVDFPALIQSLENELARVGGREDLKRRDRAVLVGISTGPVWKARESLEELRELALSSDLEVVDTVLQSVSRPNARFFIGKGKLRELVLRCLQTGSNLLVFDNELTPAQVRTLTDLTELRIIDRSQLILDIFARRAVTREGKIQVELAQLKYLLPRLATKNTAMSRLTGGIGGRGPGETKLEINRRRVRERIARLKRELREIGRQRINRRRLRNARRLPVVSIVGYTNAGKSTLLNTLTRSNVFVEDRLFATLDPSSRRLRFPREREIIITDTVGFIRDLPGDLMDAFAATLEELHDADLLLHVVDASHPRMEEQVRSVARILERLGLTAIPILMVLNKSDLLEPGEAARLARTWDGVAVSALDRGSLLPLLSKMEALLFSSKEEKGLACIGGEPLQ